MFGDKDNLKLTALIILLVIVIITIIIGAISIKEKKNRP